MARTIITLSDDDKKWLEHYSHASHQSIAMTIRLAIKFYRGQQKPSVRKQALSETAGLWRSNKTDALDYVEKLRAEWGPAA
jgi:hypothetical protein